jgi:hypothetical protein
VCLFVLVFMFMCECLQIHVYKKTHECMVFFFTRKKRLRGCDNRTTGAAGAGAGELCRSSEAQRGGETEAR